jgi:hypothetical protein
MSSIGVKQGSIHVKPKSMWSLRLRRRRDFRRTFRQVARGRMADDHVFRRITASFFPSRYLNEMCGAKQLPTKCVVRSSVEIGGFNADEQRGSIPCLTADNVRALTIGHFFHGKYNSSSDTWHLPIPTRTKGRVYL